MNMVDKKLLAALMCTHNVSRFSFYDTTLDLIWSRRNLMISMEVNKGGGADSVLYTVHLVPRTDLTKGNPFYL